MVDLFNIGDVLLYGAQGICKIDGIEAKQIGKEITDYYVLKPISNENTAVFVPVKNQALTAKMKSILTKTQAKNLIDSIATIDVIECLNENQKREQYKAILASGDREKLISLIKTIRSEQKLRRAAGKKLNLTDEQTLNKAEQIIFNELAFVLDTTTEELKNMLKF